MVSHVWRDLVYMYDRKVADGFKVHTRYEPRRPMCFVWKYFPTSGVDRSAIIFRLAVPSSIIGRW